MWQDTVFALGSIAFAAFLIPSAVDAWNRKPTNLYTAGLTGFLLILYSLTFMTLDLWYSAYCQLICAAMWILIFLLSCRK